MAQPFIAEKGVLRTSPLEKAVAARSVAAGDSSTPSRNGITASGKELINPEANLVDPDTNAAVDPTKLAQAKEAAAAGDQGSIDWLKTLGLATAVGTAATGGVLYNSMKKLQAHPLLGGVQEKKKPKAILPTMGIKKADEIVAPVPVVKKPKAALYVDGPIPPAFDDAKRFAPAMDARKARQEAKGQQFVDFYAARRARDAMKVVRRLP